MDWRTEAVKQQIQFQMINFSIPGMKSNKQFDTVTCLAVLHHVGNTDKEICFFMQNLKTALHNDSILIVEEYVIISQNMQKQASLYAGQINVLKQHQKNYSSFLWLNEKSQKDVLILIVYLANCLIVGVPEMSFPCGFRTIEQWI